MATALLIAGLMVGCAEKPPRSLHEPIVVIGIDGADWTWIDPELAGGRMPHLAALVERGSRGPLQSLVPPQKSPVIWTSIATGKRPEKHGIGGFITGKGRPTKSPSRVAATYWEILGVMGRRQAVVGWLMTYPATPVEGVLVSDYVQYFPRRGAAVEGAVHPESLWAEIDALRVAPGDVTPEDLGRFVDLDIARAHGADAERKLEELRWIYAADLTFSRITKHLLETGRYDVFSVYFRGLDAVCHAYWAQFRPDEVHLQMSEWEIAMLDQVVPRYHAFVDELIGGLLDRMDPHSRVLVVSDHGFAGHRDGGAGLALGVVMHSETGILVTAGPGLRKGAPVERAGVLDIAPTLLALSGVPPARDLDGRVLDEVLESDVREWSGKLAANAVDTYEGIVPPRSIDEGTDAEVDEEVLKHLRSLGYLE